VNGYGSQDKKEITSWPSRGVKPEDFNRGNIASPAPITSKVKVLALRSLDREVIQITVSTFRLRAFYIWS